MADAKTIWVKSALPVLPDGGSKIAFYEQDDAHPNGEAWVAGPTSVEVGDTASVRSAIKDGRIEEVTLSAAERKKADAEKAKRETDARAQTETITRMQAELDAKAAELAEKDAEIEQLKKGSATS